MCRLPICATLLGLLVDAATAAARFEAAGVSADDRIIVYCGGGIAATFDAFVLHQLGHDRVAVYDNSMSEWATTPDLPIETD
ncbi:MAG: rhodanese-like domain-containing protein [Burkholderiaceae bacterium]